MILVFNNGLIDQIADIVFLGLFYIIPLGSVHQLWWRSMVYKYYLSPGVKSRKHFPQSRSCVIFLTMVPFPVNFEKIKENVSLFGNWKIDLYLRLVVSA